MWWRAPFTPFHAYSWLAPPPPTCRAVLYLKLFRFVKFLLPGEGHLSHQLLILAELLLYSVPPASISATKNRGARKQIRFKTLNFAAVSKTLRICYKIIPGIAMEHNVQEPEIKKGNKN